jgi:hypothetical protein
MIARAFAVLILLFLVLSANKAQSQSPPSLEPNPLITGAIQHNSPTSLAKIKGFIGTSEAADTVRIYRDLSLTTFFDIPRKAVVHSTQTPGDLTAEVTVMVPGDTIITLGAKGQATGLVSTLAGSLGGRKSGLTFNNDPSDQCLATCILCLTNHVACAYCLACVIQQPM